MGLLYGCRNGQLAGDGVSENIIADVRNLRCRGAGAKGYNLCLLGNGAGGEHFTGGHRSLNGQYLILFDEALECVNGFGLAQFAVVGDEVNFHLCLRVFIDFFYRQFSPFFFCLAISGAWAGVGGNEAEFHGLSCSGCGSGRCRFLFSAASCKCPTYCCCCHCCCHCFHPSFHNDFLPVTDNFPKNNL